MRYAADERPQTLTNMMDVHVVDELKKLAAHLLKMIKEIGVSPAKLTTPSIASKLPTRKAELVKWIVTCLQDERFLRTLYNRLSSLEQAAVQEAVHASDGTLDQFRFKAKYGSVPRFTVSSSWSYMRNKEPQETPTLALLFTGRAMMPPDLQGSFEKFVPKPKVIEAPTMGELPEALELYEEDELTPLVQHNTEQAAAQDLMAILQLVDMGKIGVSGKTSKVTKAGAKAIRKVLSHGDFYPDDLEAPWEYDVQIGDAGIRPFAWGMLLQAANLAQINGNKLALARNGKAALKKPAHETLAKLWPRWLKNKLLHEMNRIEIIKGQKSKRRPLAAADHCRPQIADALAELEEGVWIETPQFFKFLIAKGHNFQAVRDPWALYLGDPNYGSFGYNHITWDHLEGRFARAFLLEYAATLGLIDVALISPWDSVSDLSGMWGADELSCLSRYDGLWAFRLNSLGAWILGQKEEYVPDFHDEPSLRVLPNLEVTLMASAGSSSDELFLDRCCERTSERVWRISLPKLLKAIEEGVEIRQFTGFLNDRSEGALPQPVRAFLKDVADRSGKVQDRGDARLIECAEAPIAHLIANDSRLKQICFLAGERCLVVLKEHENQFRKALRELGYVLSLPNK